MVIGIEVRVDCDNYRILFNLGLEYFRIFFDFVFFVNFFGILKWN